MGDLEAFELLCDLIGFRLECVAALGDLGKPVLEVADGLGAGLLSSLKLLRGLLDSCQLIFCVGQLRRDWPRARGLALPHEEAGAQQQGEQDDTCPAPSGAMGCQRLDLWAQLRQCRRRRRIGGAEEPVNLISDLRQEVVAAPQLGE